MNKILSITAILVIAVSSIGCEDEEGAEPEAEAEPAVESEEVDETDESEEPEASGEDETDEAESAGVDGDFDYPGFELEELNESQRVELAELAHIELCPCEGATNSLHECMQQQERCEEADQEASALVEVLEESEDEETDSFEQRAEQRVDSGGQHEFNLENTPMKGDPEADVIIVEFADFQCPHCQTAAQAVDEVYEEFGDEVGIYFKNYPVGGQVAQQAARAAQAAYEQGRFWEMHQLLFENQRQVDQTRINRFARQLGLNFDRFQRDMQSEEIAERVARDQQEGIGAGVTGTPAIFINGERYSGALSGQAMSAKVASVLEDR